MAECITIHKELAELVLRFLEKLFSDDVEGYWNCISKVDQARIYGMYSAFMQQTEVKEQMTFYEYVRDYVKAQQEKIYERVRENPGISNRVRYTDDGEFLIYLLEDTKVPRVYIAPTEEPVFPVVVTADATLNNNNNVHIEWKVRLYRDHLYKALSG
jgi:hypothetical protein